MPAIAPELHASPMEQVWPGRAAAGSADAARIAAVVVVALVMWNMRKRHFSHSCKTAAAQPSVKADRREPRSGRSAAESLYGRRSGGYRASARRDAISALILLFQHVDAAATQGYRAVTANCAFSP